MTHRKWITGIIIFLISSMSYANTIGHHCSTRAKPGTVALTFDDGPSPLYTRKIMAILEKHHIQATFFVVGEKAKEHPQFLKKMIADGDVVGNHSLTHPLINHVRQGQLYSEIVSAEKVIAKIIGAQPHLFRFPYGADNKRVKNYVISKGLIPVRWGYSPDDYTRPGANVIAARVIKHARSGQVILLHDGPAKRQQTVDALPKIINGIQKKGLGFSVLCT